LLIRNGRDFPIDRAYIFTGHCLGSKLVVRPQQQIPRQPLCKSGPKCLAILKQNS
jgi:hypothetical protein